ncbi:MAG: phytanoyl-CoA dioxygenase family protein [Gammaproteobacteria bacterium]|nr:phytanoyl-CoA dioxygenase family protein [Gammaproteobacteria bacterium]MBQ0839622.1 phytanoyl-CoA dioxygenase family protein [Gammaproteobacteria bacterium]
MKDNLITSACAIEEIKTQGYTVIEDFLSPTQLQAVKALLPRINGQYLGRNNFEGGKTERIYALLAYDKIIQDVVEDPRIMALCDQFLEPNYLLTTSQSICIHPGETPQPWHCDDVFYSIPRPRPMVGLSTVVAIDDFSEENGGTEIIPGSHLWSDDEVGGDYRSGEGERDSAFAERMQGQSVALEMPAGACVVFASNTLHRGGTNTSAKPRQALSNQYCQPWARTIENFYLSVPTALVNEMSPKLKSLLGYSVHLPFMGQVSGSHPLKALAADYLPPVSRRDKK